MSDEKPSLHIDLDWKKQAQEEKRRLEEEEKQRAEEAAKRAAPPAPVTGTITSQGATVGAPADAGAPGGQPRGARELPKASIQALVSTVVTQAMLYMGEVPTSSGQTMVNLDIAKLQVDTLAVLEEKTRGNLTEEEQTALDLALYEVRTRFISAAQQIINGAA